MFTTSAARVPAHTADEVNRLIQYWTEASVARHAAAGPGAIARRLQELDEEWDIERCVETMAPSLSLVGLTFGVLFSRKWLLVPLVVQAFFLQHAIEGWCPPIPLLRRLGIRMRDEIDQERYALKALRGDFEGVESADSNRAERALGAVRR